MTIDPEAERKAMEWLDERLRIATHVPYMSLTVAETLKAMLSRPVLPEPMGIENDTLACMVRAYNGAPDGDWVKKWFAVYKALHAHLTAPKTKEVEVETWGVLAHDTLGRPYVAHVARSEGEARRWGCDVVRLTGKATVPA